MRQSMDATLFGLTAERNLGPLTANFCVACYYSWTFMLVSALGVYMAFSLLLFVLL